MSTPTSSVLTAELDHVAVAVPDYDTAEQRWVGELGARLVRYTPPEWVFSARTYRYRNGGRLELLAPPERLGPDHFVAAFLARFGSGIHHVTLKVPDLRQALAIVSDAGYDVVDHNETLPEWHEAFLRPSQTGGIVIQVGWEPTQDAHGLRPPDDWPVPADPAAFEGCTLRHPDLDAARRLWTVLGARVEDLPGERLRCAWPGSPLTVEVERGSPPGPRALRFSGGSAFPADEFAGPPVEVVA